MARRNQAGTRQLWEKMGIQLRLKHDILDTRLDALQDLKPMMIAYEEGLS